MSVVSSLIPLFWSVHLSWDFLDPIFLRGFSTVVHILLLLSLLISWLSKKVLHSDQSQKGNVKIAKASYYKATLLGSLCLAGFNLILCFLNNFYWYPNGWSYEKVITFTDLSLKTASWLAVAAYLRTQVTNSDCNIYPIVLRAWWIVFLSFSCYCLVIDFVYYQKHPSLSSLFWASDVVSTSMSLFFCFVVFMSKDGGVETDHLLQESLLNGNISDSRNPLGEESVTPFANASVFSILAFSWVSPLTSLGHKKTLDLQDVPQLAGLDSVRGAFPILDNKLRSERGNTTKVTTLMLVKGLIATVRKEILLSGLFALVCTLASYVGPYLIETFVKYLNGKRDFDHEGYVLVAVFFVAKIAECFSQRHGAFRLQQAGFRGRAALVESIYSKGLTLSFQSKQEQTSGEIINLMAVDAERISDFGWYMHQPWIILIQVGLALVLLYRNLGLASIATLVATVIVMLLNLPIGRWQEKFQGELMKSKDRRMKVTSEVLRNMKILKLQAWEMKFLSKIQQLRYTEEGWLRKYLYSWAMASFVFAASPTFVSLVTFGACFLLRIPLESGKMLSALATFKILQEPIYTLPDTMSTIVQTKVSLDRIASFLSLADLPADVLQKLPMGSSGLAIEIIDGNFTWDLSSPRPCLRDININVSHGMRVAICGAVGSGKSSLLSCILGEMQKLSGTINFCGTKAIVAQSPWIQSGKIEDNILFGKEMEREKYDRVLEACSLKKDLEVLYFGDQTVIGERGINLSGGQKQRIQIARALYHDADVYLFDDPFSAVDAHTGTHLFNECILSFLSAKTVIYVTHQVEFLPAADLILVMKDGKVTQAGKYDDILKSGSDFMELVGAHKTALSVLDSIEGGSITITEGADSMQSAKKLAKKEKNEDDKNAKTGDIVEPKGQLVEEEEREKGKVGFPVYWKYMTTAYGGALVPLVLLSLILFHVFQIGSNYWMAWATRLSEDDEPQVNGSTLIIVYATLAIACCFCALSRTLSLATSGYKTSTILFNRMHFSIFRAPMSFFDSTPSGRILNRASTDQSTADLRMAILVGAVANLIVELFGIIAVMSLVSWQIFIIFIPVISISIWLQKYYISSARELSRLIGVTKAPVIQHFSETISGSSTIRSFDQESRFQDSSMTLIDAHSRPNFHNAAAIEWLCVRIDALALITFTLSLLFWVAVPERIVSPSAAGLAVTYGLNMNFIQCMVVWVISNTENKIISIERMFQYMGIPSEPPLVIESNRPEFHWPSLGQIDLQVRYAPHLPLVLRGITCTFLGGKKTGIVGRTGSGKSTLIQTLFRMVEPVGGEIKIDGINISSIGLHDLRSQLSIIPQDPTMFEGTVRNNLDPLNEYSDEEIWEALDKCQLGDEVRKKEGKLDSTVSENGENWSVGQRQLVCLGRVLLKKSKILVLDEATASVDTATDNMIQQTLKQHFYDSTVITIAHRITSVLDSDMVLLLDQGLLQEYDSPENLLEDNTSGFAKLVAEYSMRSTSS